MKNLVLFMHTTLDGFVAGPNGEMGWINLDESIFDYAGKRTDEADTALYGRVTYGMMESYWPTAGGLPNASKHDIKHSNWYNKVNKIIVSSTMTDENTDKIKIIRDNIPAQIKEIKKQGGSNIIIFGSPGTAHSLMEHNLIDEYWLLVNPVLLGQGIPLFKKINTETKLKLVESVSFPSGVVCLHYKIN